MIRQCVICGNDFETNHYNKKTCSQACSEENHLRNIKSRQKKKRQAKKEQRILEPRKPALRTCPVCGNDFETTTTRIYCSPECARKVQLIRNREYARKLRCKPKENLGNAQLTDVEKIILQKLNAIGGKKKSESYQPFCHTCGRDFQPTFTGEKYCSDHCREQSPLYKLAKNQPQVFSKYFSRLLGE